VGIALVIAGGVVLMTFFAAGFDFLTKRRNKLDKETKQTVLEMGRRLGILEQAISEKNDRVTQLENELSFVRKLLEKQ
jgi:hypothetical protein